MALPFLDICVILVYMLGTVGLGCWFYFKSRSPEGFTSAGGDIPSIVVGLSIFGTYVSSISFLALPGKAFVSNWNVFALSITTPLAAWIAVKWFVPFYRKVGAISAYSHLEDRFGTWARVYASLCYMLTQVARMGSVLFLLALPLHHLLGWDVRLIIIAVGGLTALYSMIGGIAGVIWTDAVQSVILIAGAVTCAVLLLCNMPEGPGQIFRIAAENQKFSWGSWSLTDLQTSTFWVVFWYGMAINLQNFGIDQNYVQRYHTARSDAEAKKSVWLGAILYLPISAFFLFIGTALFAFYTARPELITDPQLAADIASGKGDGVFPFFIVHQLPVGVTGLLIAAILAAAMSTIGTSMNGCATLTLSDFYTRFSPEFKKEMRDYIEYLKREIAKRDITVRLNTECKPEEIPAGVYDKIIVAIGSEVICPPIPGLDKCGYARDYLLGNRTAGKNIVVVGGGLVGSETAAHLKNDDNTVTIVEMNPAFLPGGTEAMNVKAGLVKLLKDKQIPLLLGAKVQKITEESVTYVKDGAEITIPADTVINATGYKSFGEQYADALEGKCKNIAVIGDANSTRKVFFATREAHQAIRTME